MLGQNRHHFGLSRRRPLIANGRLTPLSGGRRLQKAILDYGLGAVLLVIAAPLIVLIAIAIRLDSPGQALFRQARQGLDRSVFRIFKFRTMTVVGDGNDVKAVMLDDPRVTRVGRFLRRTGLDELPQLVNVLMGDMSLIGPRPHPVGYGDKFESTVDGFVERHMVKPGITGWAQVNGCRGSAVTPEMMRARVVHDLFYIEHWSIALDIEILIKTAWLLARMLAGFPIDESRERGVN